MMKTQIIRLTDADMLPPEKKKEKLQITDTAECDKKIHDALKQITYSLPAKQEKIIDSNSNLPSHDSLKRLGKI